MLLFGVDVGQLLLVVDVGICCLVLPLVVDVGICCLVLVLCSWCCRSLLVAAAGEWKEEEKEEDLGKILQPPTCFLGNKQELFNNSSDISKK